VTLDHKDPPDHKDHKDPLAQQEPLAQVPLEHQVPQDHKDHRVRLDKTVAAAATMTTWPTQVPLQEILDLAIFYGILVRKQLLHN
jgi:hypothetical protein